ncbi:MAG: beta-N-acetylhexosaminidase [Anaerolineae bacterium]|nr:beta-N-acetylhexosaminidase [Anaerolineae bacterium]
MPAFFSRFSVAILVCIAFPTLSPLRTHSSLDARVEALLHSMTLEQKVGQLFLVPFAGSALSADLKRMIAQHHIGGVVLFNIAGNIVTPRQTAQLINEMQALATSTGAKVPLFVAVDEEGGRVSRLPAPAVRFPSQMALGATRSVTLAREVAQANAAALKALGINMNLAPVLDVNDNPSNPVIGTRAFGADPALVGQLGVAMLKAYKEAGIIAVVKHFPGHGGADADSHTDLPIIRRGLAELHAIDLAPFAQAVRAGTDAVMTAHVIMPALDPDHPATFSPRVLQEVLRAQMGFEGLIVSDSLLMQGALSTTGRLEQAAVRALRAGVDVLAIGADPGYTQLARPSVYRAVLDAVRADPKLQRHVEQAVRRILEVKARYGLLDWSPVDAGVAEAVLRNSAKHETARRVARAAVTVLRDPQAVLPLRAELPRAFVVPMGASDFLAAIRPCIRGEALIRIRDNPSRFEIATVVRRLPTAGVVVLAATDLVSHPNQAKLAAALPGRVLVVGLGAPYDAARLPAEVSFVTAFDRTAHALEALAEVVCGGAKAEGQSPITLP